MNAKAGARIRALGLAFAILGCGSDPTGPPASLTGRFDLFWRTFDSRYSYFEYKGIDWDSLRAVFRPRAEAAATQAELIAILKEMVAPLRDVHVHLVTPSGSHQPTYTPSSSMNWSRNVWLQSVASCGFTQVRPNLGHCMMGHVAYISVGSWNNTQFGAAELDAVVDGYRDAAAMIIDVRPNGGGSDALAFELAGRFATQSTITGYVRFRDGPRHTDFGAEIVRRLTPRGPFAFTRPVVVLSGRGVFSSNESFIAAMRELPNVTVLGDTTGGGTGNPATFELGDGWKFTVSRWIEWTADRRVIEWNGIPPDVYVAWDDALVQAGRDPVLEAALNRLTTLPAVQRQ